MGRGNKRQERERRGDDAAGPAAGESNNHRTHKMVLKRKEKEKGPLGSHISLGLKRPNSLIM